MESHSEQLVNRGRTTEDVCEQQNKELSQLKTTAKKALWFSETFGLETELLQLHSIQTEEK